MVGGVKVKLSARTSQPRHPQPFTAQPEGGDAEERRWQGSNKKADSAILMKAIQTHSIYRSI
jgi:hypothetical protein